MSSRQNFGTAAKDWPNVLDGFRNAGRIGRVSIGPESGQSIIESSSPQALNAFVTNANTFGM